MSTEEKNTARKKIRWKPSWGGAETEAPKAERKGMRWSFRLKITVSFILLLLGFMLAVTAESYLYTRQAMVRKTQEYMRSAAETCSVNIESTIHEIEDVTLGILGNTTIQDALSRSDQDELSPYDKYWLIQSLQSYLSSYALLRVEVQSVCVISLDGEIYRYTKDRSLFCEDILDHRAEIYEQGGKVTWFFTDPAGATLSCARAINSLDDLTPLGLVSVNIPEAYIRSLYSGLTIPADGEAYIIDGRNTILSSYDGTHLGERVGAEYLDILAQPGSSFMELESGDGIYASEEMSNQWRLVMRIPSSYYLSDMANIGEIFALSAVILALIAAVIVLMLTKHLTRPIANLAGAMNDFGDGDFNARSPVTSEDEIGMLSSTFNHMVEDINRLCDRVYEQQLLRQDAELRTLQMQINPHFLYNTLDTINWMARTTGCNDVGEMAYCLGCLLRHSLSQGDFTTLGHEIACLKYYLKIQNYRYSDKLTARIDVDASFYNIDVPKLLIQPIVENAIIHGIEEKMDSGTVRVWAEMDGEDDVLIQVEDNGVGMSEETLRRIRNDTQDTGFRGRVHIGMANVDKRIRMYYGEGYGLEIHSALSKGTKVTMRLKALREPPDSEF